jgi:predicted RNA binding protein YcfA (HicA-like mRNA interferase family)
MKLPILKGQELISFLLYLGFKIIRQKGSHVRLKYPDSRITTVPVHKGKDIPKGLFRKIILIDLNLSLEEFLNLYSEYSNKHIN